jgi:hypothetical protein
LSLCTLASPLLSVSSFTHAAMQVLVLSPYPG